MSETLEVSPRLVGARVRNASRPEWGNGTVLLVTPTAVSGRPAWRVSVQFAAGHRVVLVPPARLVPAEPLSSPDQPAGWLDQLGGRGPDEALTRVLDEAACGADPRERVAALARDYATAEVDEAELLRWAKARSGLADPLTRWTRDELRRAHDAYCRNRDDELRAALARLKQAGGPDAVREALDAVPQPARARILEMLRRPL